MQTVADKLETVKTRIAALGFELETDLPGPEGFTWAYAIDPTRCLVWVNPALSPTKALQAMKGALRDLVMEADPQG